MSEHLRVAVADDAALIAQGLVLVLERAGHTVVGVVSNAGDIRTLVAASGPDVLITDVRMPPGYADDGLREAIALRRERPGFPVLVLSQYVAGAYARELLADGHGAVGYLLKERVGDVAEFLASLVAVAGGATVIDPEVVRTMVGGGRSGDIDGLTPREREVLALMAQGLSNAEIAGELWLSEAAVVKHIGALMGKLGLPSEAHGNRRVRAVLAWLDSRPTPADGVPHRPS